MKLALSETPVRELRESGSSACPQNFQGSTPQNTEEILSVTILAESPKMPLEAPKYDVAISFLVQDISLAAELNAKLAKGLSVFFFPHSQEELAGTDGMVSMREPFFSNSRLNVIMYRERWGNTPWTAVEAEAIKGSCLANAYRTLFIFVVEQPEKFPQWIPATHVRFNYGDFSIR
jgi:hypothetical protein